MAYGMTKVTLNVPSSQLLYWDRFCAANKIDRDCYIRAVVDRAVGMDLDANDPKWKKFWEVVAPYAKTILGMVQMERSLKDRIAAAETVAAAEEIKRARRKGKHGTA